jgi:hypothetical protein
MSNTAQAEHPAVLRSSDLHLRVLLTIATIAIVGLTVAVMVLALNNAGTTTASRAAQTAVTGATAIPRRDGRPHTGRPRLPARLGVTARR